MAETDFEDDLRFLFDAAPPAQDAAVFAKGVDRRIARGMWARIAVLSVFALVGVVVSALLLGVTPFSLAASVNGLMSVASDPAAAFGDARVWLAGLILAVLAFLAIRPALSEA